MCLYMYLSHIYENILGGGIQWKRSSHSSLRPFLWNHKTPEMSIYCNIYIFKSIVVFVLLLECTDYHGPLKFSS